MKIVVIGAYGKVAQHLLPRLVDRGHEVTGWVRQESQFARIAELGATPALRSIEELRGQALADAISGHDAVVFSAGAGGGNPARTNAIDREGAIASIDAAEATGVRRYVMVSAHSVHNSSLFQPDGLEMPPSMEPYIRAKVDADRHLMASTLDWTIVAPGRLTEDDAKGRFAVGDVLPHDSIPRADVAALVAQVLEDPAANGKFLAVNTGEVPLDQVVTAAG